MAGIDQGRLSECTPLSLSPHTYLDHSVRPVQSGDRGGLDGRQDGKVGIEVVVMFP